MLGLAEMLAPALPDTAFIAPDAPDPAPGRPDGRMWFPIPELDGSTMAEAEARLQSCARMLDGFLDLRLAECGLNPGALALVGFSQGAGLCYEVGPRRPVALAGVVAIAGRMKGKERLSAEVRSTPPFLILNGTQDRLLDPVEIDGAVAALSRVGITAQRLDMADVGHGISADGIAAVKSFLRAAFRSTSRAR